MGSRGLKADCADQQAQRPESVLPPSATQHLLALQRTAGNHAVARMLAPAAPRTASPSATTNPAAAQAVAGNRAIGRVLARKKLRADVEKTLSARRPQAGQGEGPRAQREELRRQPREGQEAP